MLQADELVVEHDLLLDTSLSGQPLEHQTVGFAIVASDVWVGRAEHEVDDIGIALQNGWHGGDGVLDALVGREQTEGQEYHFALGVELIFEEVGIYKRHIGNAVGDVGDLLSGTW